MSRLPSIAGSTALVLTLACVTVAIADGSDPATMPAPGIQGDDATAFLSTVLATTEDFWGAAFTAEGLTYEEPKLVLFSGMIDTACGVVSGSSYCTKDHRIYIDPEFPELQKVGANGELAQSLILARDVAYHVQNITAASDRPVAASAEESNATRVGLQADCFVGLWSRYAQDKGLLKDSEVAEARDLLGRLGDKNQPAQATSEIVRWYNRGLAGKAVADCNAFKGPP